MRELGQTEKRALDLANQSLVRNCYTFSGFLSPEEQDAVMRVMEKEGLTQYSFYGGTPSAMRAVAVFGSESDLGYRFEAPVEVLHIQPLSVRFAEHLTHRDYLGALMSLGLERDTLGDILIREQEAWLFCLETVAEYIIRNLTSIRHTSVTCSRAAEDVPMPEARTEACRVNAASERLDAVVAAVTGLSRTRAQELIRNEKIFVNGRCVTCGSREMKPQEILTIRGFGKMIYQGVTGTSKKGRYYITIHKYV